MNPSKTFPMKRFFRDDSGIDLTNDYSTPNEDDAVLSVPSGAAYVEIDEIVFSCVIAGSTSPAYGVFLGDATLTNGFPVKIYDADNTEVADLTDGDVIKDNDGMFKRSNAPILFTQFADFTPDRWQAVCIWRFAKPIILRAGEQIRAEFSDDLSAAANLQFEIQANGRKVMR